MGLKVWASPPFSSLCRWCRTYNFAYGLSKNGLKSKRCCLNQSVPTLHICMIILLMAGKDYGIIVQNNPVNFIDPTGLIWVTKGTSFSGYGLGNFCNWILNRITRQVGEGMDPSLAGSDPSEFLGLKRDIIQEWQSDPNNPCRDKEFPIGTIRKIPQTYQRFPFGYSEPSIVDPDSPAAEGYGWFPGVPNNTYNSYPGATYPNLFYWRQGK